MKCNWCHKYFKNVKELLEDHQLKCNNELCSYCGVTKSSFETTATYNDHFKKHNIESHSCDECNKNFLTEKLLKVHNRKVHAESDTSSNENSIFQVFHTSMIVSEIFSTPPSFSDTSSTGNLNFQVFHTSITLSEIFSTPPSF